MTLIAKYPGGDSKDSLTEATEIIVQLKCFNALTLKCSELNLRIHVRSCVVNAGNFVWTASERMIGKIAWHTAARVGERQAAVA